MIRIIVRVLAVAIATLGLAVAILIDHVPPRWMNAAESEFESILVLLGICCIGLLAVTLLIFAAVAFWSGRRARPSARYLSFAEIFITVGGALLFTAMAPTILSVLRPSNEFVGVLTVVAWLFLGLPGMLLMAAAGDALLYHRRHQVSPRGFPIETRH